uniref:synaptic vesicular amine transporter-like n=1 Tax=Ciona intestinalis TaxID=7719 RepID=UPI000180D1E6|nr:synaptic vesicular amine transporter-like [Ciona intestinalis]|eukprot:XP_026689821.1 synaptic vesicular amine transporter-like [Ciona intestinalis]
MGCSIRSLKLVACLKSKKMVIAIVYAGLMVDNMLLTAVVPVLPAYFFQMQFNSTTGKTETTHHVLLVTNYTKTLSHQCPHRKGVSSQQSFYMGILLSAKPLVQVLANFAVGPITDKIGFDVPLLVGYIVMAASSLMFAFGKSFVFLLVARAIQGIGSAATATAGLSWVADTYTEKVERGWAIGMSFGGLALGVLVGPTYGSLIYQYVGKEYVFIILAVMTLLLIVVRLTTREIRIFRRPPNEMGASIFKLFKDPYILVVAISLCVGISSITALEAVQPTWMLKTMCPTKLELGVAFLPISGIYFIVTYGVALWGHKVARWMLCLVGFYLQVVGLVIYPFARTVPEVIGPGILIGIGISFTDSLLPVLAFLVDTRHKPVYGSVYAIADIAFSLSYVIGPLIAGAVMAKVGFKWAMWGIGFIFFSYAPIISVLSKVNVKDEEETPLLKEDGKNMVEDGKTNTNNTTN